MKRVSKTRRKPLTEIGRLHIGLSLVWLLLLVAGSCTQTDVEEDVIPPHALKDVDAGFNLSVLANQTPVTRSITFTPDGTIESDTLAVGVKDSVQTKATAPLTDVQESQISNLWVGQYDATSGARLSSKYLPSLTGTTVNLALKQNQSGSKSHVYFVSNAGDLGEIATEYALKRHTLAHTTTSEDLPDNNLCKMVGMWEGEVVAGGVKDIIVELTRLLAKITFTYSMGAGFEFTPTSVVLNGVPSISQVAAPTGMVGIPNTYHTGTASNSGATVYWYMPENMAGTVTGANAVDSEKKKIGTGVTFPTHIQLRGNAKQGGVLYENVTFRFYPGSNMNNYDIRRNTHYAMTVTLMGIDLSDERITVGNIPPIQVGPVDIPAKKGGEKAIQITARPGQAWTFDMPVWLSAVLNGQNISSGATITHQGPANVIFKAAEANPKAEKREFAFKINVNGTDQDIKITQAGSTLTTGGNASLAASAASEGSSTFTTTEGLGWSAALNDNWLGWATSNPGTSGNEAPAGAQTLKVKATASNPSASQRSGKITVKVGASVWDATYTGLKKEITVNQAGSTVTGSTANNIAAKGATGNASFTAPQGLAWASSVTSGNWITLNSGGSGTATTGSAQTINYTAAVNPSSSGRSGTITVRAGDATAGPTGNITLNQLGATLSVSGANTVAAGASTGNTSTFTATPGLSWNVGVASTGSWLSLTGTTSGTNNTPDAAQTITYSAVVNPNASTRNGTITVKAGNAVSGTDAGLTKTITVTQSASSFSGTNPTSNIAAAANSTTRGSITATAGLAWTIAPATHNGITVSPTSGTGNATLTFTGAANTGDARTGTFTISVTGASPARTATIAATQKSGAITLTINSAAVASYQAVTTDYTLYPPFNYDEGLYWGTTGSDRNGVSSTCTLSRTYSIEIEKTDRGSVCSYVDALSYCSGKGSGWRVPTIIELKAIYDNKATLQYNGCAALPSYDHWSSSVYNGEEDRRCKLYFGNGSFSWTYTNFERYVRCVRDAN